jgi:hypothetical protein
MTKHLIIPDSHAHPDYSNDRFTWLGHLVADAKPDVVVMIGDWADMPSLCSYDKGTKGFEGRRYHKDIEAAIDAQEKFFAPIKARKKKLPRFVMLEGNHEHRIQRAISTDAAQLEGIISLRDFQFEDRGWEFVPYEGSTPGVIDIDGITYAHYFTSGVMNRPIGGENPARQLLLKQFKSCSQGHIHIRDNCVRTDANGKHIQASVVGWFGDFFADFAGVANYLWWSGVLIKEDVQDGMYDPHWIGIERLRRAYG